MPNIEDLVPQLPWEGPPIPEAARLKWPLTLEDLEKAVAGFERGIPKAEYYYQEAIFMGKLGPKTPRDIPRAIANYRVSMQRSVEQYRHRLLKAFGAGRW